MAKRLPVGVAGKRFARRTSRRPARHGRLPELSELERGPTAGGATENQLARRKKMAQQLVIEESKHEAVEEMYFWPAVREHLEDGDDLANQAQQQEQEGKEVLDRLEKLGAEDAAFEPLLAQFIKDGRAHIAFEEERVWPGMRSALSAAGPAVAAADRMRDAATGRNE